MCQMYFINSFPKNMESVHHSSDLGNKREFVVEVAFEIKNKQNFAKQWEKKNFEHRKKHKQRPHNYKVWDSFGRLASCDVFQKLDMHSR